MEDQVKLSGVLEEGYGISPKMVMRDTDLTIESKAIYAYMASFAGNGANAFPKIATACKDLNISKDRFVKHREYLIEKGYITIEKHRKEGKFENNVYVLNTTVSLKHRHGKTPTRYFGDTNNNNINNNSVNNNIYTIFEHWKNQNIINHRELTQKMKSAINARLKSYSVDELKQAISNYQEILNSDEYYWTHKWTIQDFMKPDNVVRFLDESNPKQNFKSSYKPDNKERKVAWF